MSESFRVIIQPEAQAGIEEAFRWIEARAPQAAKRWRQGMYEAVRSLATFPTRCPLAPEDPYFPEEIRQLLYGKRSSVYRILFTIEGDTVSVLYVRHSAQRRLVPQAETEDDEREEAEQDPGAAG